MWGRSGWQGIDLVTDAPGDVTAVAHRGALHCLVTRGARVEWFRRGDAWERVGVLTDEAQGLAALASHRGGLVAVVPVGGELCEFRLGSDAPPRRIGEVGTAPAALASGRPGLRLVVPRGDRHEVLRRSDDGWYREQIWSDGTAAEAIALVGTRLDGWLQALTQEGWSIFQHHRQAGEGRVRWMRASCLRLLDRTPFVGHDLPSRKVAQLTGERDRQPGHGPTWSSSLSTAGVRGTDLGVRVTHAGASYLLFGDTHWTRRRWGTLDAIARLEGERLRFHASPLLPRGEGMTRREYDVPLDAFSLDDDWFVFFSSNHFARHQVMGRSVLTRAVDSPEVIGRTRRRFRQRALGTFSTWRFVNVSVQVVDHTLWVWGTGAYRADGVRLAKLDLTSDAVRAGLRGGVRPRELPWRFWTPLDWSAREEDAVPLFAPAAMGELSVRWAPEIGQYLMLTMSGPEDPIGPAVVLRTASKPWGPWSTRRRLIDWLENCLSLPDASSRFMAAHRNDELSEQIFRAQGESAGGAYAPYLFDWRVDGADFVVRYTLSTWNPYQVMLMEHRVPLGELPAR